MTNIKMNLSQMILKSFIVQKFSGPCSCPKNLGNGKGELIFLLIELNRLSCSIMLENTQSLPFFSLSLSCVFFSVVTSPWYLSVFIDVCFCYLFSFKTIFTPQKEANIKNHIMSVRFDSLI